MKNTTRMKSGHGYDPKFGFTGSAGMATVKPHLRSAPVRAPKLPEAPPAPQGALGGYSSGGKVCKPSYRSGGKVKGC